MWTCVTVLYLIVGALRELANYGATFGIGTFEPISGIERRPERFAHGPAKTFLEYATTLYSSSWLLFL
jgi:hypothetical protein